MNSPATWFSTISAALLLVTALWLPGWGVLFAAGTHRKDRLLLAPLFSAALVGVAAIIAPFVGLSWGWLPLGLLVAVVLPVGFLFRWRGRRETTSSTYEATTNKGIFYGALLAIPASSWIFFQGIGALSHPPQTWDAVFHLNALRWIYDSGNASSLNLSSLSSGLTAQEATQGGFYPAGFHAMTYLGWVTDPVVTTNLFVLLVTAVIWPLGMGLLARTIVPEKPFIHTATMVLAVAYTAFPERPSSYGTLWPNVYAYALVPLMLVFLVRWFGRTKEPAMQLRTTVALIIAALGIGTAHPTGVLVALIATLVLLIDLIIRLITRNYELKYRKLAFLSLIVAALVIVAYYAAKHPIWQTVTAWKRAPIGSFKRESFGAVFDSQLSWMGYGDSYPDWVLGTLTLIGALVALYYARYRWALFTWGIYCYLFVASAVINIPGYVLVAPWYSDAVRLGAMVPLLGAFIAALGLNFLIEKAEKLLGNLFSAHSPNTAKYGKAVQAIALVFVFVGTNWLGYYGGVGALQMNYKYQPASILGALVSEEEVAFIRTLPQIVEPGAAIATDPRTGGSLIYAYTGLPVVHRHLDGNGNKDQYLIAKGLGSRSTDWRVCDVINQKNIRYFYTDDVIYWPTNEVREYYVGFEEARKNPTGMELIAEKGKVRLYKITDCSKGN
ncbi:hypothetical protein NXS08_00840 [Gleimia sp. 6138-11-ORH1]|uniref:DUF6541 family protein n=1 Tax=Gleimia sp. 6138-11-ORH1 TaxID=2973937 RepID=UPI002168249B|nr:DUF6541 family protein [Gleimia sp. 6138-11-ORH1]MCS4484038.1 hypothetical protein [Gleimia sp. 6138-11-ORH1]